MRVPPVHIPHKSGNLSSPGATTMETRNVEHPSQVPPSQALSLNDELAAPPSEHPRRQSALSFLLTFKPTLTLTNTGSVARDHLASERTWLAYIRTSLAIASTGVALVQLFSLSTSRSGVIVDPELGALIQRFARPLGAATVLLALCVLVMGVLRYFKIQKAMTEGQFPVARKTVISITVVLAALVSVMFGVLVAIPRRP